jgi:galactokinase/mevalonate kinase-like predicted kinase
MAKRCKTGKSGRPELLVTRFVSLLLLLKHERPAARSQSVPVRPRLYRRKAALYGGALASLASMGDVPAGTGLGSSGNFTTALLRALHTRRRNVISPHPFAEQACHIEINLLGEPVGKQDQFIAAFGALPVSNSTKTTALRPPLQLLATKCSTTSRTDSVFSSPAIRVRLRRS